MTEPIVVYKGNTTDKEGTYDPGTSEADLWLDLVTPHAKGRLVRSDGRGVTKSSTRAAEGTYHFFAAEPDVRPAKKPRADTVMTYTQLDKVWEPFTTAHVGLADQGPHAEEFKEFWERVKNKAELIRNSLPPCLTEHPRDVARPVYESGRDLVEAFMKLTAAFEEARGEDGQDAKLQSFIDTAAPSADRVAVDVAIVGYHKDRIVQPDQLFDNYIMGIKYKKAPLVPSSRSEGRGQLVDRANRALQAQKASALLVPGFVTDNQMMECMVIEVTAQTTDQSPERHVAKSLTRLTSIGPDHNPVLDIPEARKELMYMCWVATGRRQIQANASPAQLKLPGHELQVAVPGGEQQTFRLGQPLSPMRLHGGVLGGVSPDGQQVAVKLGPAPRDRRMAEALCLRRERWAQVDREREALLRLGTHGLDCLPQLVASGTVVEHAELQGSHVVVTAMRGTPLYCHNTGELLQLSPEQLDLLAADGLEAICVLLERGMFHNDMAPDNLVMLHDARTRPWQFSIIDLGAYSLAVEGRGSGLVKLAFSSDDILRAGYPRRLSDAHSLLFSCMALSGKELPWAEAAAAHDRQRVLELRCLALKEGASAPLLGGLSPLLRSFAEEVFSEAARWEPDMVQLGDWVRRLRTQAHRSERSADDSALKDQGNMIAQAPSAMQWPHEVHLPSATPVY